MVSLLRRFGAEDAEIAESACEAIGNLAMDDDNRVKLASAGACEVVANALQRFGTGNAGVAESVCGAIFNVANKHLLQEAGAQHEVSRCLVNTFKTFVLKILC